MIEVSICLAVMISCIFALGWIYGRVRGWDEASAHQHRRARDIISEAREMGIDNSLYWALKTRDRDD